MGRSLRRLTGKPSSAPVSTAPPRPVGGGRQQGEGWSKMKFLGLGWSPEFYSEKRYLWAVMDLGLGYKFKLGRIFLADLFFVSGLTEMGEIRPIRSESQNLGADY